MSSPSAPGRALRAFGSFSASVAFAALAAAQAPVAGFTTTPNPAEGGDSLTVQFIDQSIGDITSWSWDLGDGTTSLVQNPAHTYGIGTFAVSLTVSGPGGSDTLTVDHAVDVVETLFGFIGAPPPLSTLPVGLPENLDDFVADREAAIRLGKALFWDIQLGSDGLTACASCHYHAGTDNRPRNTLHPGANGTFDPLGSGASAGPNVDLTLDDFPFTKYLFPDIGEGRFFDTDDRRGTAGVHNQGFDGIDFTSAVDLGTVVPDPTFQIGGLNTLQVTGRDAPTTIGAVFFHRIFWDGRANHTFNGVNIWGDTDPSDPKVLEMLGDGSLGEISVRLKNAAAASQAIGPPLSGVEMSWAGRSWPEVGKKLIPSFPLALQEVDPTDSVLGSLANPIGDGLTPGLRYEQLIHAAFHERWWGSAETRDGFTHMEQNFSLFFGLAILMYESTLIPDQTRYDTFAAGDEFALTEEEKRGLGIFTGKGQCVQCHGTPMFAGAITQEILIHSDPNEGEGILERMAMDHSLAVGGLTLSTAPEADELLLNFNPYRRRAGIFNAQNRLIASVVLPPGARCLPAGKQVYDLVPTAFAPVNADFRARVVIETDGACLTRLRFEVEWNELGIPGSYKAALGSFRFPFTMPVANPIAVYDNGFYNIGVRQSAEDLGVGANGPFGPLSMTRRKQNGETLGSPSEEGVTFVGRGERVAVDGAFKTPTLRNIELTGPYFHNGGQATLEQVVEFYARGTDFGSDNRRDKDPDVGGFSLSGTDKADLVAFMKALTDPRVRHESAPFDHPELPLKVGHLGDETTLVDDGRGQGVPAVFLIPATGAAGGPPIPTFEERLQGIVPVTAGGPGNKVAER
jgi:cytochrome c peroxidase